MRLKQNITLRRPIGASGSVGLSGEFYSPARRICQVKHNRRKYNPEATNRLRMSGAAMRLAQSLSVAPSPSAGPQSGRSTLFVKNNRLTSEAWTAASIVKRHELRGFVPPRVGALQPGSACFCVSLQGCGPFGVP